MQQKSVAQSARRLRVAVIAVSVGLFVIYILSRLNLDFGHSFRIERRDGGAEGDFPVIRDLALAMFLSAMVEVVRLLGRLGAGEMFTPGVTRSFRGFALWLLLSAIVSIAGPTLMSIVQPAHAGPMRIQLIIDLRQTMFVVAALVIFLVARVIDRAAQIEAELKEIV